MYTIEEKLGKVKPQDIKVKIIFPKGYMKKCKGLFHSLKRIRIYNTRTNQ